jgi:hypothetical protein
MVKPSHASSTVTSSSALSQNSAHQVSYTLAQRRRDGKARSDVLLSAVTMGQKKSKVYSTLRR